MKYFSIIIIISLVLIPTMISANDTVPGEVKTSSLNDIKTTLQTSNIDKEVKSTAVKTSESSNTKSSGSSEVTLYREASRTSEIIIVLKQGDSIVFMDREKEWVKVATEPGIGWVDVNELVIFLGGTSGGTDSIEKTDTDKTDTDKTDSNKDDNKTTDTDNNKTNTNDTKTTTTDNNTDNSTTTTDNGTGTQAPPVDNNTTTTTTTDNGTGTQAPPVDNSGTDTGVTNTEEPPVEGPKGIPATIQYTEDVHVRMEKTLASDSPVVVSPGTQVNLLSIEDDWCKIEYEGKIGFVRSYYLGLEK